MLKRTLINFTIAAAAIGIAATFTIRHDQQTALKELKADHNRQLKKVQLITENEFFEVLADTRILSKLPVVDKFLETDSKNSRQSLQKTFTDFVKTYQRYDQIRIISNTGQEIVRVNLHKHKAKIVADKALQDKSHRYYVQKGLKLKPNQFYISPIDLNIENGHIEHPLNPVVRFVTPIVDSQEKVLALLVVNYRTAHLFHTMETVFNMQHNSQYMLLNQAGYWLISPKKQEQWAWMTGHLEVSFRNSYPKVWSQIKLKSQGMLQTQLGIYNWLSFNPFHGSEVGVPYKDVKVLESLSNPHSQEDTLHLVLFTPKNAWLQQFWWQDPKSETLILSVLFLVLLGSIIIARFQRYHSQLAQSQRETYNLYVDLYHNAPFGYGTLTPHGVITDINNTLLNWLGYEPEDLQNRSLLELVTPDCVDDAKDCCDKLLESNITTSKDLTFICKNADMFHANVSASTLLNVNNDIKLIRLAVQDINQKFILEQKLIHLANTDPLTDTLNRRAWFERARHEWARSIRHDTPLSVMMLDLDHFKVINDTYGHDFGDLVLKTFVEVCKQHIRETDLLARFGGEEFCILLPDTDLASTAEVATRLKQDIANREIAMSSQSSASITVSIGISTREPHTAKLEQLIKQADNYLYQAKNDGRNQIKSSQL